MLKKHKNYYFNYFLFVTIVASNFLLSSLGQCNHDFTINDKKWVGTWATAPQLVEPHNMPPSPGLTNNTLRQVVRVSIGGNTLRIKFSNEFSASPVIMNSVQIAVSTGGHSIDKATNKQMTFNGKTKVKMGPGDTVVSDPLAFGLQPRMDIAITIYYGETSVTVTGHPGSRTTSYILEGNNSSVTDFSGAVVTDRWYNINRIDVMAPIHAASVAILGNSITDGRGSITNQQNRWPDIFSELLLQNEKTQNVGVLNMGIGGNCMLSGGLGPTGLNRYQRDILNQPGVRWTIMLLGVNDIGGVKDAEAANSVAKKLIESYSLIIDSAHNRNIKVYCATIMPFKNNSYYNEHSETCRNVVNAWIRSSGRFDAVIDFDKVMQDPQDEKKIISSYQNDGLHPDADGYRKMGESVDLTLFESF